MIKRSIDVASALIALLVLSPLLLPVMLILRLTGEGEVFYLQRRIGKGGRPFDIVKFATMLKDSPNMSGGDITVTGDPRVLPFGRFLRKTKINELPQLLNVLSGTMSLIGPRPITPRQYEMFPQEYRSAVATVRPGLSGLGSVVFRDEERLFNEATDRDRVFREVIIPYKSALERWYVDRRSLMLDLKLIAVTVLAVLRPDLDIERFFEDLPQRPEPDTGAAESVNPSRAERVD